MLKEHWIVLYFAACLVGGLAIGTLLGDVLKGARCDCDKVQAAVQAAVQAQGLKVSDLRNERDSLRAELKRLQKWREFEDDFVQGKLASVQKKEDHVAILVRKALWENGTELRLLESLKGHGRIDRVWFAIAQP